MKLTVIGMGTKATDCTLAAYQAIQQAELVLIKTENNHVAQFLKERGIAYGTLDSVYEKSRNFDSLNKNLAKAALTAAKTANTFFSSEMFSKCGIMLLPADSAIRKKCEKSGDIRVRAIPLSLISLAK